MDFNQNYFEIFQFPVAFELNTDQLSARYRKLQSSVHPDRFVAASDQEKRLSLQWATQVNAAYDVLKTGLSRAIYLLELAGVDIEDNPRLEPDFLMQQIELREQMETIAESGDLDELDSFKQTVNHLFEALELEFATQFGACGQSENKAEYTAAQGTVYKLQFINKLLLEAEKLEEKLLDY